MKRGFNCICEVCGGVIKTRNIYNVLVKSKSKSKVQHATVMVTLHLRVHVASQ